MTRKMINYEQRGVSPHKPDVKKAIEKQDKGLFPGAFCKAVPDYLTNDKDFCLIEHADGAGTKSSLGYIYYRLNRNVNVFKDLAQDSLVMNLDDLLCVGSTGPFILSNTIGRNAKLINGDIVHNIIDGYSQIVKLLRAYHINIYDCGGETADLGDLVRTVIIDSTMTARMRRNEFIDASKVKIGQDIIGFASYGQATYETKYNSGISSNGFTSARHELLCSYYKEKFPETYAPEIDELAYIGKFKITDLLPKTNITIGEALLSPTRTYAPLMKKIFDQHKVHISAVFHNTGGGQTKCLRFGKNIKYIKNNLFPIPPIFQLIKDNTNLSDEEMYRVYNMGHRMEIVCDKKISQSVIDIAKEFKIEARVVGNTEKCKDGNCLIIETNNRRMEFRITES